MEREVCGLQAPHRGSWVKSFSLEDRDILIDNSKVMQGRQAVFIKVTTALINTMTINNPRRTGFTSAYSSQAPLRLLTEVRAGAQTGQGPRGHREALPALPWLIQPVFFYSKKNQELRDDIPPTSVQKIHYRLAHRLMGWMHFLN